MNILRVMLAVLVMIGADRHTYASTERSDLEQKATDARVISAKEVQSWYDVGVRLRMREDNETAFKMIKKAADAGYKRAQSAVGSMYLVGIGTDCNVEQAITYYEMCCDEVANAANDLGIICEGLYGEDYEDAENALFFYKQAETLGLQTGKDNYNRLIKRLQF